MRAGLLPRGGGALIAAGAVLYAVGGFSLAVFGPASPLVTVVETSGSIPLGAGFVILGWGLWRDATGVVARA